MLSATDLYELTIRSVEDASRRAIPQTLRWREIERERVARCTTDHLTGPDRQVLLDKMRKAAEGGEKQCQLLAFPSDACTDRGRRISSRQSDWSATLQGKAADIYKFWDEDLRPQGFGLAAEVISFPGGKPGDIGLTVQWG